MHMTKQPKQRIRCRSAPFYHHILSKPWIVLLIQNFWEFFGFSFNSSSRDVIDNKRNLVLNLWCWGLYTSCKWIRILIKNVIASKSINDETFQGKRPNGTIWSGVQTSDTDAPFWQFLNWPPRVFKGSKQIQTCQPGETWFSTRT